MQLKNAIENADNLIKSIIDTISIVIVAHVLNPRGYTCAKQINCSELEQFTVQEFNEIYQGLVKAGFFVEKVFFSEIEFIQDVLKEPDKYSSTVVFNLCRNGIGMNKKTAIPSVCDLLGILYTSSGAGQCAIARNKMLFTTILDANNIRVPISSLWIDEISTRLPNTAMVICKPNNESASQGIDDESIGPLYKIKNRKDILVQEFIDGYECEVPVFCSNNQCFAMPPIGLCFNNNANTGVLSCEDSKTNKYGFYSASDIIPRNICEQMMNDAEKAFILLELERYGRIDFRIDKNSYRHYVIDISTTPYITQHSSFAFSVKQNGSKYSDIFKLILGATLEKKFNLQ